MNPYQSPPHLGGGAMLSPGASSPPRHAYASPLSLHQSPIAASQTPKRSVTFGTVNDQQIARRQESASKVRLDAEALLAEQRDKVSSGATPLQQSLLDHQWAVRPAPVHHVDGHGSMASPLSNSPLKPARAASPYQTDVYIPGGIHSPARGEEPPPTVFSAGSIRQQKNVSPSRRSRSANSVQETLRDVNKRYPLPTENDATTPSRNNSYADAMAADKLHQRSPQPPPQVPQQVAACQKCQALEAEVVDMKQSIAELQNTVTKLAVQVRQQAQQARPHEEEVSAMYKGLLASQEQQLEGQLEVAAAMDNVQYTPSTPPPTRHQEVSQENDEDLVRQIKASPGGATMSDEEVRKYVQQLGKSNQLKSQAGAMSAPGGPPGTTQMKNSVARDEMMRVELRVFEKRLLSAVTQLANRVSALEGDVLQCTDDAQRSETDINHRIDRVVDEKVSESDLKQKVTAILSSSRDDVNERLLNLYRLFDVDVGTVQAAIAGSTDDRVDTLLATPALRGVFEMSLKNMNDLTKLQQQMELGNQLRQANSRSLNIFNRLLGLEVADEHSLKGVRVTDVFAGGPSLPGGIKAGDVISSINHVPVGSKADMLHVMSHVIPNSIVKVHRIPQGRKMGDTVEVIASNGSYLTDPNSPIKPVSPYAKFGPQSSDSMNTPRQPTTGGMPSAIGMNMSF